MTFMTGLQCHLCGAKFPAEALWVCDQCLGPLEVVYDYDGVREAMTREVIEKRPRNVWRFKELLPISGEPRTGFHSGCTPLVRADRLARKLGLRELYIKDDSVNHPTLSYKDRVVSVAATRAVELGLVRWGRIQAVLNRYRSSCMKITSEAPRMRLSFLSKQSALLR